MIAPPTLNIKIRRKKKKGDWQSLLIPHSKHEQIL
jgi:hypothetical protein